jgi:hypothetical protein
MFSIAIAICWTLAEWKSGLSSEQNSLRHGMIALFICMGSSPLLYSFLYSRKVDLAAVRSAEEVPRRRTVMPKLVALGLAVAAILATTLPLPKVEAAILDRRLKATVEAGYNTQNIAKAAAIVKQAQQNNLSANPKTISEIGSKILASGNFEAGTENPALLFANYRSRLNRLPPGPYVVGFVTTTPGMDFTDYFIGYGTRSLDDGALWESPNFQRPMKAPVQRIVVKITRQTGFFELDNVHIRNITFDGARVRYAGGPLRLESVQFVNCTFETLPEGLGASANTRDFLAAVLLGDPITIDLK